MALFRVQAHHRQTGECQTREVEAVDRDAAIRTVPPAWQVTGVVRLAGLPPALNQTVERVFAWRPSISRAGKITLAVSLCLLLGMCLTVHLLTRPAGLPTIKEAESRYGVWPGDPEQGVIRGRPVTEVPFYRDASRPGATHAFTLLLDQDGRTVGWTSEVWQYEVSWQEALPDDTGSAMIRGLDESVSKDARDVGHNFYAMYKLADDCHPSLPLSLQAHEARYTPSGVRRIAYEDKPENGPVDGIDYQHWYYSVGNATFEHMRKVVSDGPEDETVTVTHLWLYYTW